MVCMRHHESCDKCIFMAKFEWFFFKCLWTAHTYCCMDSGFWIWFFFSQIVFQQRHLTAEVWKVNTITKWSHLQTYEYDRRKIDLAFGWSAQMYEDRMQQKAVMSSWMQSKPD